MLIFQVLLDLSRGRFIKILHTFVILSAYVAHHNFLGLNNSNALTLKVYFYLTLLIPQCAWNVSLTALFQNVYNLHSLRRESVTHNYKHKYFHDSRKKNWVDINSEISWLLTLDQGSLLFSIKADI